MGFIMKALALIAPFILASTIGTAHAGPFLVANYGRTAVGDWQDLVTAVFTARYRPDAWQVFVYSDAGTLSRGVQAVCNAIVGVVPKDSHQFPARQFVITRTATVAPGRWNDEAALDFETECVRSAIDDMMNVDPATVYRPHGGSRKNADPGSAAPAGTLSTQRDRRADPAFWEAVARRNGMSVTRLFSLEQPLIDAMAEAYVAEMQSEQAGMRR